MDSRGSGFDVLPRLAATLLDLRLPAHTLHPEVVELAALLDRSATIRRDASEDISRGETRTSSGLALSPAMAALCTVDFVRTIEFLRGAEAAVRDARSQCAGRPVRVLYAGCGPYATLAVPLMAAFGPDEASFTLLDLHAESIESARCVVDTLGLTRCVERLATEDASAFRVPADGRPDLILVEVMKAGLEAEPQVAVTRHLLAQAPDAILVPEEVRIELILVDVDREFDVDAGQPGRESARRDRLPLGTVFVLNRRTVSAWTGTDGPRLPASDVRIPTALDRRYEPMLFTVIDVYKGRVLRDYDSGLTCPRRLGLAGPIEPGDTIRFHYQLGTHPRLVAQLHRGASRP